MAQTPDQLTHLDDSGTARMVDVGDKPHTRRVAIARAVVAMLPATAQLIADGEIAKGDVSSVARIAGIQAAKRTWDLIPLAHPIPIAAVNVDCDVDAGAGTVTLDATATTTGQTGIEMEAMTACSVAALTVYDMVKGVERGVRISDVRLIEKSGGRSGTWRAEGYEPS